MDDGLGDQDEDLYRIVYDSVVLLPFGEAGEDGFRSILASAQACNARDGITGVLRYDGAYFLQVLEGPRAAVQATMARIMRDPRHTDVRITSQGPLARRDFGSWTMALVTDQQVAVARRRNPDLLDVQPYRAAEVVASFREVLEPEG
jgi:hypothetical protein